MTKVLAFDVGNSFTKLGCFVDGELAFSEGFPTDVENLGQYQEELAELLPSDAPFHVDGVVVASVVPAVQAVLAPFLAQMFALPAERVLWVTQDAYDTLQTGVIDFSAYQAQALGADRVANAVAGQGQFPGQKVLVGDFGTTATFEMVDEENRFIGGAILPGPVKFQSLVAPHHAAQLFEVDVFQAPKETPGLSTQTCLENGLYYGYKGALLEIVGNLLQDAQWPLSQVRILFTGGYADRVRPMLTMEMPQVHMDPGLTLKGLHQLWELNITPVGANSPSQ